MIKREVIDEVKNRLVKAYDPLAIYLFGSYAWGTPTEDSDLELLIATRYWLLVSLIVVLSLIAPCVYVKYIAIAMATSIRAVKLRFMIV